MQKKIIITSTIISLLRRAFFEINALVAIFVFVVLMSFNELVMSRDVHDVHTHGSARLSLAYEYKSGILQVQFESPAINLIGFENKPKNQSQIEMIEKTKALLSSSEKIFTINGSKCSTSSVDVNISGPAGQGLDNQDHNYKHDHHHHGSDEHDERVENHSEVTAMYVYSCNNEELESVTTSLFELFSRLEKITVEWVTETQQGQNVLQEKSTTIKVK